MSHYSCNHYGRPAFYESRQACGPCQPQFEDLGYVAYRDDNDPIRNSPRFADGFWQSLYDPTLGPCVNEFGHSGIPVHGHFPHFNCDGGGHDGGYYAYPDHGEEPHGGQHEPPHAGSHGAYYQPHSHFYS